jgi:competence protein ComFC
MSRVQAWAHYSLGLYDDVLKKSIQRFKFEGMHAVGTFLAKEFVNHWKNKKVFDDVDLICPIPISRQRYFYRGFNQSALLARYIGKSFDIPVHEKLLKKIRDIVPQMELKREERLNNVVGAFCLTSKIDLTGKRIILLDDVLTTGATILECIRIIQQEYPSCTFKIITLAQA